MGLRRARVGVLIGLWIAAAGCFGDERASAAMNGEMDAMGPSGAMMGSTAPSGDGQDPEPGDVAAACQSGCEAEAACRATPVSACTANCVAGAELFGGRCAQIIADEAACVGGLGCDELEAYIEGRRAHAICGAVAGQLIDECTINGGVPPDECDGYCEALAGCGLAQITREGCAENCLIVLTALSHQGGADCADVQRRAFDCFLDLSCEEHRSMVQTGLTASPCASFDAELTAACR